MFIKDMLSIKEPILSEDVTNLPEMYKEKTLEDIQSLEWESYKARIQNPTQNEKVLLSAFRNCKDFVEKKISIVRYVHVPPYLKRGQKGFLLEERVIAIFPENIQKEYEMYNKHFSIRMCLFYLEDIKHEWVCGLPTVDFKVIK